MVSLVALGGLIELLVLNSIVLDKGLELLVLLRLLLLWRRLQVLIIILLLLLGHELGYLRRRDRGLGWGGLLDLGGGVFGGACGLLGGLWGRVLRTWLGGTDSLCSNGSLDLAEANLSSIYAVITRLLSDYLPVDL